MITRPLGQTGLDVSLLTLGTMTWGQQNTEAEAHAQIDQALAAGVNLLDAAEMYPVPPMEETYGATERIIGNWFSKTGRRNEVLLATKAMGPGMVSYVRGGPRLTREQVIAACEASLKRLQTDVIDLYQLHWPERPTNYFGKLSYTHNDRLGAPIEETLRALETLVQSGKVRHIGVSNETPWANTCGCHAMPACHASPASRTRTRCSTAASRSAWPSLRTVNRSGCWPIRPWPSACSAASIWATSGPPMAA